MANDEVQFVRDLYRGVLRRDPRDDELGHWAGLLSTTHTPAQVLRAFLASKEFGEKTRIASRWPTGHYYSPVVDPVSVRKYVKKHKVDALVGIDLPADNMLEFWGRNLPFIKQMPQGPEPDGRYRYYINNGRFPMADAAILRAMIAEHRPRQIIEIGSGFSSACMLDTVEELQLRPFCLTCIDPYADRLRSTLRTGDEALVRILERPVQEVPIETFRALEANDILFIDSTHVMKTGSDVHYELFSILPNLRPGVLIHFHDIQYPFEYPDQWIFDMNHSWNEIYVLRAFLMFNTAFRVEFWGGFLRRKFDEVRSMASRLFGENMGGSIWIRKVDGGRD